MAELKHDKYELNKLVLDLPPVPAGELDLLKQITYTGMTFSKMQTSVTGDRTDNNTVLLDDYGTFTMTFFVDPNSTSWADLVNDQINGKWPKDEKPTGTLARRNHAGDDTSSWDIERWFITKWSIGPLNSKQSQTPLSMRITIRPEKFVLK